MIILSLIIALLLATLSLHGTTSQSFQFPPSIFALDDFVSLNIQIPHNNNSAYSLSDNISSDREVGSSGERKFES